MLRGVMLALALACTLPANAAGLFEDLQDALEHDPQWRAAQAVRDAGVEAEVQGRAGLLPQVSFSGSKGRASTDSTVLTTLGPRQSSSSYDTLNYSLQLRQPLIRPRAWASYGQGKAQAAYAESNLRAARQDLAQRVVTAFTEWGYASAAVQAARAQRDAFALTATAAQRSLQAGTGTRTELETARARLAQADAQVLAAEGQVESAILGWRQITGRDTLRPTPVIGTGAALRLPLQPASLTEWQATALAANGTIAGLRHAVEAAREELRKVRADHLPTLDLYATRTRSQSDTDVTIGNRYDTTRFGVQLSVPIYAGGAISSQVRQAQAGLRRAESELEAARQEVMLQVERDWHMLQSARAQSQASVQALDAATLSVRAARMGIPAGTATRIDEIDAITQQAGARRDLIQADASAVAAWSRLMALADQLDESALRRADALLSETATPMAQMR